MAHDVIELKDSLPRVKQELGDTWIHGIGSDPWKIARFRELSRLRRRWINSGKLEFGSGIDMNFSIPLMMVAEHTWGLDVKTHLKDWDIYELEQFNKYRSKPNFKKLLNKDDPIDKIILELAKKGELNVGVVWVKGEFKENSDDYSYKKPIKNI